MKKVILTGSNGFVGTAILKRLSSVNCFELIPVVREIRQGFDSFVAVGEIGADTQWGVIIDKADVIIHTAARVHVMVDASINPIDEYRRVNVAGTLNLARQAAARKVKRFIFISSIKVNGETTTGLLPFNEGDTIHSLDSYGVSKIEAENGLRSIAAETGMEVVIIRPPLVYGAGVKANFHSLLNLASKRLPLPFGSVHNKRSMVYLENLVDFIVKCIDHPAAANQTFLISDGEDVSLSTLLKLMRSAYGQPIRLFAFPVLLFKLAGVLMGKRSVVDRLVGDLQVDSSKAFTLLDWQPPFTVKQGINATVKDFVMEKN